MDFHSTILALIFKILKHTMPCQLPRLVVKYLAGKLLLDESVSGSICPINKCVDYLSKVSVKCLKFMCASPIQKDRCISNGNPKSSQVII